MKIKSIALSLILMMLLSSCAEVTATATIKILLHTKNAKTITLGDTVLDVTKFTVSGNGPGGKTFAVDSTSSSVSIPGMPIGFWEIEAVGYNSKGKEIARGSNSFDLTSKENSVSITLSNATGAGSLLLKYDWDEDVTNPSIQLSLISYDKKNKLSKKLQPSTGTSSCSYTLSDIPSGFYTISSVLYNGTQKIVGSTEAVRIANSEKTTGTISFKQGSSYSQDLTSLNLFRSSDTPLTGHFEDTPLSVNSGEEFSVDLVLDSSYSESEKCMISWYLDGELSQIEELLSPLGSSFTLIPQTGTHIVNAVVSNPSYLSLGSCSFKFTAKASGIKGVAVYLNTSVKVPQDSIIGALPSDHFCILIPSGGTLSLYSIYNNSLSLNSKVSATDEGFSWLTKSDNMFTSAKMTDFFISDSNENTDFLFFNMATSKLENSFRGGSVARFEKQYSVSIFSVPMTNINACCFSPNEDNSGLIMMSSSDSHLLLSFKTNTHGLTVASMADKPQNMNEIRALQIKKDKIVALCENSSSLFSASFNGSEITSVWSEYPTEYRSPEILKFINSENLLVSDGENLSRYVYSKSNGWRFQQKINTSVKFLEVSDDGMFFWVITKNNILETYTTQDNFIHVIGSCKLSGNITSVAKSDNYFLLKTDQGNLILCQISKGL